MSPQHLEIGKRLGHYEILRTLGKGGMGEVYLARDTKLNRNVALKFLRKDFTKDIGRVQRFEQEARTISALNHPNILTIHEIGEADGHGFIVTELVDGETLRHKLAAGPLKLPEALHIAEQIASALASAHAAGIIHRDIKPENVMLRRDGIVKVLDFGLAKLTPAKESNPEDSTRPLMKTDPGMVLGTVTHMSPEQARGQTVDARTDIWSLGVVLYEMLTGHAPFGGATTTDVIAAILEREPKSLNSYSPELPEAVEWLVAKALTKDCEGRYQTAPELLNDLQRLRQRLHPAAAGPRSSGPTVADSTVTASHLLSKRQVAWAALALVVIVIAGVAIWKRNAWFKSTPGRAVVVLMDSPIPDRVYDPETRKNGGTNADDITDIISDLPIVIEKENTSPLWHREEQVVRENPVLIVIHRSCFADASVGVDPHSPALQIADKKLDSFLGYASLGDPNVKFLVYTRRSGDQEPWKLDLQKRFPQLSGRIVVITIPGGPEHATFRDPETAKMVRQT